MTRDDRNAVIRMVLWTHSESVLTYRGFKTVRLFGGCYGVGGGVRVREAGRRNTMLPVE